MVAVEALLPGIDGAPLSHERRRQWHVLRWRPVSSVCCSPVRRASQRPGIRRASPRGYRGSPTGSTSTAPPRFATTTSPSTPRPGRGSIRRSRTSGSGRSADTPARRSLPRATGEAPSSAARTSASTCPTPIRTAATASWRPSTATRFSSGVRRRWRTAVASRRSRSRTCRSSAATSSASASAPGRPTTTPATRRRSV